MKHVDVIERLQRIRQFYRDTIEDYTAVEAVDLAISALEKQEQDRWIPVTEILPESKPDDLEYPTVLVSFSNGEVCTACYYESTKEWGTGEDYNRICYPIAWRPLPEPYMEEEA